MTTTRADPAPAGPPAGTPDSPPPAPARRWAALRAEAAVVAGFVAVAVFATWPLGARLATDVPYHIGDALENAWIFGWGGHAVADRPFSLFHGNVYHPSGFSLAFAENMLGLSVPLAPLFWLTGNAVLSVNVASILVLAVGGWATYALARSLIGSGPGPLAASRWPAVAAGVIYTVAPYRVFALGHVHTIATHLTPLVLLALVRLSRRPTWARAVLVGVILAWQFWSSLTGGVITIAAVGAWGLWVVATRRRQAVRPLALGAAGVALGLVLVLPLAWAYGYARHQNPEYAHDPGEVLWHSATPGSYLDAPGGGPLVRDTYAELAASFGGDDKPEQQVFPGIVALAALALAVPVVAARSGRAGLGGAGLLLGLAVVVGFVLSLGPHWGGDPDGLALPFGLLETMVPGGLTRVPARFANLAFLGGAGLIAVALACLPRRAGVAAAVVVAGLVVVEAFPGTVTTLAAPDVNAAHRSLAAGDHAVLALPTLEYGEAGLVTESTWRESIHMYRSTANFQPLVNGYGAFLPAPHVRMAKAVQDFPTADSLAALAALGVDRVVVETDMIPGTRWADAPARLAAWPGIHLVARSGDTLVYEIGREASRSPG
ncbi:MAG TPA: hypothetical protein VFO65_12950 [Acidimicrobiales bacterium]|nr:hypothetical protein [Acidimicrobiales bacterium]